MIDESGSDEPNHRFDSRSVVRGSLAKHTPGAAANAPKRNVLIGLAYLVVCLVAVGLLWPGL